MSASFAVSGSRIVVTGGTRGIGRAVSLRLAREGAEVLANHVRNDEAAEALRGEAQREGLRLTICRADLTSRKGLDALGEAIGDPSPGAVVSLVHCAATGIHRPVEALTGRHFDWTFALNVRAFLDLVQLLLPRMGQGSSIVAVSSEGAVRAVPHYSLVGASKGALESLVRHLAAELAPRGIRVNAISPGTVETGAWDALPDREARLRRAAERSPSGRLTTVDEVAAAAQFLCSEASSGIVGHTLVVDGGKRIVE